MNTFTTYTPSKRYLDSMWRCVELADTHKRMRPEKRDQFADLHKRLMVIVTRLYGAPIDLGIPMPKGGKANDE